MVIDQKHLNIYRFVRMTFISKIKKIAVFSLGLAFFSNAHAISVDFSPQDQTVDLGDMVFVDITISDLGDFALGGFDLDISFDDSIVEYSSFTFGDPINGDQLDLFGFGEGEFQFSAELGGVIDIIDVSLDFSFDLIDFQLNEFVLGTIAFNTLSAGTTALGITQSILSDEWGFELDSTSGAGAITVLGDATVSPVPLPGSAWLMLFALLSVGGFRNVLARKSRSR